MSVGSRIEWDWIHRNLGNDKVRSPREPNGGDDPPYAKPDRQPVLIELDAQRAELE